jgi:hypothetical protein
VDSCDLYCINDEVAEGWSAVAVVSPLAGGYPFYSTLFTPVKNSVKLHMRSLDLWACSIPPTPISPVWAWHFHLVPLAANPPCFSRPPRTQPS